MFMLITYILKMALKHL